MTDRLPLAALNQLNESDFTLALEGIFEHAPWVGTQTWLRRPFASVADLHEAMLQVVLSRSTEEKIAFVRLHPDLAGKAAQAGAIEPASVREQTGLGLDQLAPKDFARFERLNAAYHARFGFPFVICVRRQTRDAVLDSFERRLGHDREQELATALAEIGHITRLRLAERIDGPGMPIVNGWLSTHVLDTHSGAPGAGIRLELFEVGRSARALLLERVTNADGRTDQPLIVDQPLRIGTYELVFHVGPYFAARIPGLPVPGFLDAVPLRFGISQPESHYHVPLVVTPWSYATYRGS